MGVRLTEKALALGFGAGEAFVASKLTASGPMGIPWTVLYEGAGVATLFFGNKVGISSEVSDSIGLAALGLAGARLGRVALSGKLALGPKAWGGDHAGGDWGQASDAGTGGLPGGRSGVRQLTAGRGGGFSLYPVSAEAPGVAG